jgi:carbonic anhydrase
MTGIVDEVLTANLNYSRSFGEKARLGLPPARRFAILTCMDARLDPAKYAGLSEGDAHVIRNAGGRATDDAIRSLVISYKLLGTREWFVIHHTDCGMELFTDDVIAGLLERSVQTSVFERNEWRDVGQGPGSSAGRYIKWHTIRNLERSVIDDVAQIRAHDLVPGDIPIYGYIYDVRSGRLSEVSQATRAGRAVHIAGRQVSPSYAASNEFSLDDG